MIKQVNVTYYRKAKFSVAIIVLFFLVSFRNVAYQKKTFFTNQMSSFPQVLNGQVRSVKVSYGRHGISYGYYTFDESGNLTYRRDIRHLHPDNITDPDTVILKEDFFKYNNQGKIIEQEGTLIFRRKINRRYDSAGNEMETTIYSLNGDLESDITYSRFINNNREKEIWITKDGKGYLNSLKKLDDNGNLVKENLYTDYGKLYSTKIMQYDKSNKMTESAETFSFENEEEKKTYTYDNKKRNTEIRTFKNGKLQGIEVNKYDDNDSLTEQVKTAYDIANEQVTSKTAVKYKYDNQGVLIDELEEYMDGTTSHDIYSDADKEGNYLSQTWIFIKKRNGQVIENDTTVTKREIEYY